MTREEYIKELKKLYELAKEGQIPYSPLELLERIREVTTSGERMNPKPETTEPKGGIAPFGKG